jgi:hypothetical protein
MLNVHLVWTYCYFNLLVASFLAPVTQTRIGLYLGQLSTASFDVPLERESKTELRCPETNVGIK